jgi:hypothetical protein
METFVFSRDCCHQVDISVAMIVLKHGARRAAQYSASATCTARRSYASRISIPFAPPPFPVLESCPAPTCQCRETPAGLDIEREQSLNGSMASYAEHVLISTGRDDWKSKIEDEDEGVLVRKMKKLLLKNGKYSDVSETRSAR